MARPGFAALAGVAGYVFLQRPDALHLLREDRSGSWQRIKASEADVVVTRSYATAWIDHGVAPADGSYAYVLLPGADAAATARFSRSHEIEVAANTGAVQAVRVADAGYIGANFAAAGTVQAGPCTITASGPVSVSVLVRLGRERSMEVAVSDATRAAATLDVSVSLPTGQAWSVTYADSRVSTTVDGASAELRVAPGGTGGSHRVVLGER